MKRIISLLFAIVTAPTCMMAQIFPSVSSSGQTLYYQIIGTTTNVKLTTDLGDWQWSSETVKPKGNIVVPSHVTHQGTTYTVTEIYDGFHQLDSLAAVSIPSTVTTIENGCFTYCTRLSHIYVDDANLVYDSRENCNAVIKTSTNELVAGCKSTVIPNTVTKIAEKSFWGSNISTIVIPVNVHHIGFAFVNCDSLQSVYYNAHKATFSSGNSDFYGMYTGMFPHTLTSLTIGADVDTIVNNVFTGQSNLQQFVIERNTPPIITPNTFSGIPTNIPITVPCGAANSYCNAPYWNQFTNFIENGCPELCMVGVEDNYNVLYWNTEQMVSAYNLYRESAIAGEYELMATVPYESVSRWVDTASRPNTRSYRYKISTLDSDGNESALSHEHKTMHLSINQGLGGRWNLQWTPYEGADYTTYIIYRGTNATDLQQIDIMPADGNTSYSDETAPEGDVYYQVGIVVSTPCSGGTETAMGTKSTSISLSNIATNSTVGIDDMANDGVRIYSLGGRILVEGTTENVQVFDMEGRQVENKSLQAGVYLVKIGDHAARKIVVVR